MAVIAFVPFITMWVFTHCNSTMLQAHVFAASLPKLAKAAKVTEFIITSFVGHICALAHITYYILSSNYHRSENMAIGKLKRFRVVLFYFLPYIIFYAFLLLFLFCFGVLKHEILSFFLIGIFFVWFK